MGLNDLTWSNNQYYCQTCGCYVYGQHYCPGYKYWPTTVTYPQTSTVYKCYRCMVTVDLLNTHECPKDQPARSYDDHKLECGCTVKTVVEDRCKLHE